VLVAAGQDPARVTAITTEELQPARPARRPTNSVLATTVLDQLGLGRPGAFEPALRALVEGLIA
jgi:hypothetical protein